jgi:predicted nucleic acid-binding protein
VDFLVTGDKKHLQPLKTFRGIQIVSPREFLDLLRAKGRGLPGEKGS